MSPSILIALGVIAIGGACAAMQAPVNARLGSHLGGILPATAISFLVGFLVLGALTTLSGRMPALGQAATAPWWVWAGGILGAAYVWSAAWSVGTLGVVTMIAGLIFGQLVAALVIDATGAFGLAVREISPTRLAAVALVGAGLVLSRF
jgi:transporter family-2 protein